MAFLTIQPYVAQNSAVVPVSTAVQAATGPKPASGGAAPRGDTTRRSVSEQELARRRFYAESGNLRAGLYIDQLV